MPKIDIAAITPRVGSSYPGDLKAIAQGRERRALGDAGGLTQFGCSLTRVKPGSATSQRHWHEVEDEMVYILEGELVLVEDGGETVMRPGDAATFKAGVADGHHLVNRSDRDAVLLEMGTRPDHDVIRYSDVDLVCRYDGTTDTFTRRSGERY
jgi:uncharacterized cupin superfamily protein